MNLGAGGLFSNLADWVFGFIEFAGYIGIGLLVALTNVIPLFPVEVILLLGGFVSGEADGLWTPGVVAVATVGSVAGAMVPYTLGYRFGEERLRRFIKRFGWLLLLKEADLDRANLWFDRHDGKAVFLSRLVPGARKAVPIPAGIACMPIKQFMAYTTLGSVLSNSVFVVLGWLLGDRWFIVRQYTHILEYAAAIALAAAVAWFVWSRLKKRKRPASG
ncbi:MAG: DedA family protein [Rubrobacteraceae bacterium]